MVEPRSQRLRRVAVPASQNGLLSIIRCRDAAHMFMFVFVFVLPVVVGGAGAGAAAAAAAAAGGGGGGGWCLADAGSAQERCVWRHDCNMHGCCMRSQMSTGTSQCPCCCRQTGWLTAFPPGRFWISVLLVKSCFIWPSNLLGGMPDADCERTPSNPSASNLCRSWALPT